MAVVFPDLKTFKDPDKLRKLSVNARRLGHMDYAFECQLRIGELAGLAFSDEIERAFWTAVTAAEEFKTEENGRTTRMTKTRTKHKRVGAQQVLDDWATDAKLVTDGFQRFIDNGRPDLTGEAIVIRHPDRFTVEAVAGAITKLEASGVKREVVMADA